MAQIAPRRKIKDFFEGEKIAIDAEAKVIYIEALKELETEILISV